MSETQSAVPYVPRRPLAIVEWHRSLTGEHGYAPTKWVNPDGAFNVTDDREKAEPVPRDMADRIAAWMSSQVATKAWVRDA